MGRKVEPADRPGSARTTISVHLAWSYAGERFGASFAGNGRYVDNLLHAYKP